MRLTAGVRRRLAAVLLLALALPALALAADTDPKKRFTTADKRKAASLVLRKSDFVAGWKQEPATPDDGEDGDFTCPNYNPDESDLVLTGEAESEFAAPDGFPSVISAANVYRSRQDATASWTRGVKPQLVPCFANGLKQAFEEDGARVTVTRKGKISFPRFAPRTVAYRFSFSVTMTEGGKSTTLPLTIHFVALGHGRGDVMLMSFGFGPGIPLGDLKAFAQLSAQRLAAAKL
jgi:hypothetical protein